MDTIKFGSTEIPVKVCPHLPHGMTLLLVQGEFHCELCEAEEDEPC
jgi:hypothetical protein